MKRLVVVLVAMARGCSCIQGANICDCAPYESIACSNGRCVGSVDSGFGPIDDAFIPPDAP